VRALFAWCKFMIVFIPVTDLVIVMQINYYYYYSFNFAITSSLHQIYVSADVAAVFVNNVHRRKQDFDIDNLYHTIS